ncbi:complement C1q-like protein 4 [Mercenaria mercenaria]|uniref:complement C1q-like protein 4 n=1 Tax=Mercenaria mercenaria TaxID=6596 RepID=UPI00234EB2DA|nr:complement C1q-like protein 4 [Mercenaria mercenaria]
MFVIFIISISLQLIGFTKGDSDIEPGQCLSRYDYDYKVMKQLVDLTTELQELKKKIPQGQLSVAFMAQLSESIVNPPQGSVIAFDSVLTNVGEAYNAGTGTFVADVDGIYSFHLFASSPKKDVGNWLHMFIMRNTEQVGYVYLDDNNDRWAGRSTTVVVHLHHGDKVNVKMARTRGSGTLAGCCFHTHFGGFLISQD